jgi:hypothetical protein
MDPKVKAYLICSVVSLVASYILATLAVGDGTALTVWYALMAIGTGILGSVFAVVSIVVIFGWDK